MKSRTLMKIAVAGAFGLSTAAIAGPSHEVLTPYSPNEAGETSFSMEKIFGSSSKAVGSTSARAGGEVSGSYSGDGIAGNVDQRAALDMDETLALADEGIYNDFYVVSYEPASLSGWDYYVLDTAASDRLALSEEPYWLMPTHDLALIPSTTDEMVYDVVLVPATFADVTAEFGSGLTENFLEAVS